MPVLGYGTDALPGFYVRDTGLPVPWRVDSPEEVAAVMRARDALRLPQGMVVAQPVAAERRDGRATCTSGRSRPGWPRSSGGASPARTSRRSCSAGSTSTPAGASLRANVALVLANAALAARDRRASCGRAGE